jgi:uncharacterized DUF497 family protein
MEFEWDGVKNLSNFQKHKIFFEVAIKIFEGPVVTTFDDRKDYGEVRELAIGLVDGREVTVCYTDRGTMRRIISARNATPGERKNYWKQMSAR